MADLRIKFAGITSPNPFWLASAPPTNSAKQIHRAFEYGWGGAVWKTIGAPVLNVSNRYGGYKQHQRLAAINNIELISDRPLEVNLREIKEVKQVWPDRTVIVSAMVESKKQAWHDIILRIEDTGADGIELNYGCPHGMSERGMGSAVGQVPEYCQMITEWVMEVAKMPVIVKLTPNVADIAPSARAAALAGADAISLINTINSIIGVDLDNFHITPNVGGLGSHGGYAGAAVKPIALNMLATAASLDELKTRQMPISGMGGISTWRDAAEFLLLGATSLQVCTAVMHHGYRIIEDLCDGLSNWLDEKGFKSVQDAVGMSLPRISRYENLDLSYKVVAKIDQDKCIQCNLCYVACNDTAHQCIDLHNSSGQVVLSGINESLSGKETKANKPIPVVREEDCVGCALCYNVCPVESCIEMIEAKPVFEKISWKELITKQPELGDWTGMENYRKKRGIRIH